MQPVTYKFAKSSPLFDILSLVSLAAFVFPLLMAAGIALRWLEVPGTEWIKSRGAEDAPLFMAFLGLAVILGVLFIVTLAWKSPARNFLLLDDIGLTYAFMGLRHRWPWRALERAEVDQTGVPFRSAKLVLTGTFRWIDRVALLFLNGIASSSKLTIRLPDFYEVPIEEVVAAVIAHRKAALGEKPADADARDTRPQALAASGQTVLFTKSGKMYRLLCTVEYIVYALILALSGATAYLISIEDDKSWHEMLSPNTAYFGVAMLFLVVSATVQKRAIKPKHNNLHLDGDGFVYTRAGKARHWSWHEMSGFTLHLATSRRLLGRRRFITFAAPGRDWRWRWLRWQYGLPGRPPLVLIEDIYELPLAEIVEALNQYRDRALSGTTSSKAPGPAAG